jgi:ribosomal protein S18 acetylase RimI-like enzyme
VARADVQLVRVDESNALEYKEIRLAMLLDSPRSFAMTHAQELLKSDDDWRARTHTSSTWMARVDGARAGAATMYVDPELPEGEALLVAMWVDPAFRGRGVGDALIGQVVDEARAQGIRRLQLDVVTDNAPAVRLYERLGFVPTDHVVRRQDDPCTAELRMVRDL